MSSLYYGKRNLPREQPIAENVCSQCGKAFPIFRSAEKKVRTCSPSCAKASRLATRQKRTGSVVLPSKTCQYCGKIFEKAPAQFNADFKQQRFCSRRCAGLGVYEIHRKSLKQCELCFTGIHLGEETAEDLRQDPATGKETRFQVHRQCLVELHQLRETAFLAIYEGRINDQYFSGEEGD